FSFVFFVTFVVEIVFVPSTRGQTFRGSVTTVEIPVTVTDTSNRLIAGLTKDDFEVFEDGDPQPVTQFSDKRTPVSVGVLLDISDSMRGQPIIDARGALDRFMADLLDSGDEAFVGAFNHLPRILVPWTAPPSRLAGRLADERPTGAPATQRIAEELNSQYTLGYATTRPQDGSWRTLRVHVKNHDYVARARRGYFATPPKS